MSTSLLVFACLLVLVFFEGVRRGAMTRRLWHELIRLFILLDLGAHALVRFAYPARFVTSRRGSTRHGGSETTAWPERSASSVRWRR